MILTSVSSNPLAMGIQAYPSEETMLSAVPRENTVGLVTEQADRWVFSPREPEQPEEGLIWILTGSASAGTSNALRKNGIILCPVQARQYREGIWQHIESASFLGGSWIRWAADRKIYESGVSHVNLTLTNAAEADGYLAMSLGLNGSAKAVSDPVLLAGQARLVVEYRNLGGSGSFAGGVRARVWDEDDEVVASSNRSTSGSGVLTLNISELSGQYKVGAYASNSSGSYTGSCRITAIRILMEAAEA